METICNKYTPSSTFSQLITEHPEILDINSLATISDYYYGNNHSLFNIVNKSAFSKWLFANPQVINVSNLSWNCIKTDIFSKWFRKNYKLFNLDKMTKKHKGMLAIHYPKLGLDLFPNPNETHTKDFLARLLAMHGKRYDKKIDINKLPKECVEYLTIKRPKYVKDNLTNYKSLSISAWQKMINRFPSYVENFDFSLIRNKTLIRELLHSHPILIKQLSLDDMDSIVLTGKEWKNILAKNVKVYSHASAEIKEAIREYRLVCKLTGRDK